MAQPHHCHVAPAEPFSRLLELESGDTLQISEGDGTVLVTLDDLADSAVPTALLTPAEALRVASVIRTAGQRAEFRSQDHD